MQLTRHVHLVGSGALGFAITDPHDCHIYLLDGGDELALVDVGAGMGAEAILAAVRRAGFDPAAIRTLLLTHAHGDHAGGAARMRALLGAPRVLVAPERRAALETGDEEALSVAAARAAGGYPADYVLAPCPVDGVLADGDRLAIGDLALEVIATPGHCDGHVSLLVDPDGRRDLLAGDAVFAGGRIILQAIHDCRLEAVIASLRRLRPLRITGLFPGHGEVVVHGGRQHVEHANAVLDRLLIPGQLIAAPGQA